MGRELTPKESEEYLKYREEQGHKAAELLGIPYETLVEIENRAREEVLSDDSWEKELAEKNKRKAGIL